MSSAMKTERAGNNQSSVLWHPALVLGVFVLCWFIARLLPRAVEENPPLRLAVALVIVPALLYFFLAQREWLRRLDELQQRMQLEGYVGALAAMFFSAYVVHFVKKAGFFLGVEFFDVVGLSALAGYVLGYLAARKRYNL